MKNKWFTDNLLTLKTKGRSLQKRWQKTSSQHDLIRYTKHAKVYKLAVKKCKKEFVQHHITSSNNTTKALFNITRALSNGSKNNKFSPTDPAKYCENVAIYFKDKVVAIKQKIESETQSAEVQEAISFFQERQSCKEPEQHSTLNTLIQLTEAPTMQPVTPILNSFRLATPADIKKIIEGLGSSSSALDPIPTNIIKQLTDTLLPDITHLVNNSILQNHVPASWKMGLITPLPKKESISPNILSNLRPVTQLRLLPRIIEAFIIQQIQSHLEEHVILHDYQSGFRPGRGTEGAMTEVREQLLWCADRCHPVLLVLLDLSAAFDTVDHNILLQRLEEVAGIKGHALAWFRSFLSNRLQAVKWGEFRSSQMAVECGVPQGSALSPILFNIYMRPLASLLEQTGLRFQLYADDTQIMVDLHESVGDKEKLAPCLTLVKEWMRANKLCLNNAKTELVAFQGRRSDPAPTISWPTSWGQLPPIKQQARDLGIRISHRLDGAAHAAATVSACHQQLNAIARILPLLDLQQKKQLYSALVGSRLCYGLTFMLSATKQTLHTLQKVQNRAIRLIFNLPWREHIGPWRQKLGWLSVEGQLTARVCTMIWRALKKLGPHYTQRWIRRPTCARQRRRAMEGKLQVPAFKKVRKGGTTMSSKGAKLWNSLPAELRGLNSLPVFKRHLRSHLLSLEKQKVNGSLVHSGTQSSSEVTTESSTSRNTQQFIRYQNMTLASTNIKRNVEEPIRGLSSPPLRGPLNLDLIKAAAQNKRLNTQGGSNYQPRRIPN